MAHFRILLSGGPRNFPNEDREQFVTTITERIKHRWGAGYEHFVHDGEFTTVNGEEAAVYRWECRTAIAE